VPELVVDDGNGIAKDAATIRPGRPRRFSPDTEQQLILDAAMVVMRKNASADANVTEILDEAGLSTRAFYRHFASKDELLRAMHRRESERASQRLVARVESAAPGIPQLEAWIDELLSFVYDRRKAVRVALLSSDIAQRAATRAELDTARMLMNAPLVALLDHGRQAGAFPNADPERHARPIQALVNGLLHAGATGTLIWPTRGEAVAEVLRFCLPALGVA
jgi:AcrR family transcriptional regulator